MNHPLALAILFALTAPLAAQHVLVVDAAGRPGTDFRNLANAVAAAAPGDILRIRGGRYASVVVQKPLKLVADRFYGSVEVDALAIEDIPAGAEAAVSGLLLSGVGGTSLVLRNNRGLLTVDMTTTPGGSAAPAVEVTDCAAVTFFGSRLGSTLRIARSLVLLHESSVSGPTAGVAIDAADSEVRCGRVSVTGGNADPQRPAAPAVRATDTRLVLVASMLRGGHAAGVLVAPLAGSSSVLELGDSTSLDGPPDLTGFVVKRRAIPVMLPSHIGLGAATVISVAGAAAGMPFVLVAGTPTAGRPLGSAGRLWIDPATVFTLHATVLSHPDQYVTDFQIPNLPQLFGVGLALQAAVVHPAGNLELLEPTIVQLRR